MGKQLLPVGLRGLSIALSVALCGFAPAQVQGEPVPPHEPTWVDGQLDFTDVIVPKGPSQAERDAEAKLGPRLSVDALTAAPLGPLACPPEHAPTDGILLRWSYSSANTAIAAVQAQIGRHVTTTGQANLYVCHNSTTQLNDATTRLAAAGADMSRVKFLSVASDSVWMRDYGPRYVYEGQTRVIVDHTYNRSSRTQDDVLPIAFAAYKKHTRYDNGLVHGGGNFHVRDDATGHATRLLVNENPSLSEATIKQRLLAFQGLALTFYDPFRTSVDSTQHIDMWMQVASEDAVVISDWPLAGAGYPEDLICEGAATQFANAGYAVFRVPAVLSNGVHYTYTNVVLCNDIALIPFYDASTVPTAIKQAGGYNDQALATWRAALPGKTVTPVDCDALVTLAGVMHCIVMHVPAHLGGQTPTAYVRSPRAAQTLGPGSTFTLQWNQDDDVAVTSVDLLLSTDDGATFDRVIATGALPDGEQAWTVPNLGTPRARVRVVARDVDGRSGQDESPSFTLGGPTLLADLDLDTRVEVDDVLLAAADLGRTGVLAADLVKDRAVRANDLAVVASQRGKRG